MDRGLRSFLLSKTKTLLRGEMALKGDMHVYTVRIPKFLTKNGGHQIRCCHRAKCFLLY